MSDPYHLIPGVMEPKTNCKIHYAHVITAFVTLAMILIVTIITSVTVNNLDSTLSETNTIINDLKVILPEIQEGYILYHDLTEVLCADGNFTRVYPKYREKICGGKPHGL